MTIQDYLQQQRVKGKITPAIEERWNNRILQRGWQLQGRSGANSYLGMYGKSIGAAKVVGFALVAEREGHQEMANRFWEVGYQLATGKDVNGVLGGTAVLKPQVPPTVFEQSFPKNLQPGKVSTKNLPDYDGTRCLIFGTPEEVAYQEVQGSSIPSLHLQFDEAVVLASKIIGPFVAVCERYYVDNKGLHHKTLPKTRKGAKSKPTLHFIIHRALYSGNEVLTDHATEREMLNAATNIAVYLSAAAVEITGDASVSVSSVQNAMNSAQVN